MNLSQIHSISNIAFLIIIAFFALITLMTMYIFIRYGRTKTITVAVSLVFAALFFLASLTAFVNLQKLF